MNKTIYILLVALMTFCATSVAAADRPSLPKNSPKWLVKDMKKESRKKKLRTVKFANDTIEVQITGGMTEAPEEVNPGVWYMYSNYGGEVDVNCWVITEPRYLFDSLLATANSLLDSTAELNDNAKILSKEIYHTETGFLKGIPHGALERLFLLETENEEQLLGLQKARAAQRDGVTFVCEHSELGYIKTFEKMFHNFVLKAKIETPKDKHFYKEQQLVSINDKPVGFVQVSMALDADGDTKVVMQSGVMLAPNSDSLSVSDTNDIEFSYPDGRLINTVSARLEDGVFKHDLQISRNEENAWLVEGTQVGKEIQHLIDQEKTPLSIMGQMFQNKAAVKRKVPGTSEALIWRPNDVDVGFTTATLTTGKSKRGKTEAVSVTGSLKLNLILDDSGSAVSSQTRIGDLSFKTQRVSMEGAVRSPDAY